VPANALILGRRFSSTLAIWRPSCGLAKGVGDPISLTPTGSSANDEIYNIRGEVLITVPYGQPHDDVAAASIMSSPWLKNPSNPFNRPARPAFNDVTDGRRRNVRANRGKDTKPEMTIRRMLHALGYRYRRQRHPWV
jgi:DNA mismatch endonuclease Vsr